MTDLTELRIALEMSLRSLSRAEETGDPKWLGDIDLYLAHSRGWLTKIAGMSGEPGRDIVMRERRRHQSSIRKSRWARKHA